MNKEFLKAFVDGLAGPWALAAKTKGFAYDSKNKLPPSDLTLNDIRSKISGLHFSQESLSKGEKEIFLLAESLLNYIDLTTKEN